MPEIKAAILSCFLGVLIFSPALAHRMEATAGEGGVYVRSYYEDSSPATFARVRVLDPEGEEFTRGVTDANGVFAFVPDSPGNWRVEIDDGMGHRVSRKIEMDRALELSSAPEGEKFPRLYGAITGVALIFGFWGLAALLKAHKRG